MYDKLVVLFPTIRLADRGYLLQRWSSRVTFAWTDKVLIGGRESWCKDDLLSEVVDKFARQSTVVGRFLRTSLVNPVPEVTINNYWALNKQFLKDWRIKLLIIRHENFKLVINRYYKYVLHLIMKTKSKQEIFGPCHRLALWEWPGDEITFIIILY